jgi:2'-5' RNA ligase
VRLFVAVWLPPDAAAAVAAVDRPEIAGLRWTTPDQWHVTLRFLGSIDDEAAAGVAASLRSHAGGLPPVAVRLGPTLGRFGRRVLHVPVSGLEPVAAAVAGVAGVGVGSAGGRGPADDHDFHGHLTLGRARDKRGVDLRPFDGVACGPIDWTVGTVTLVRSHLDPGGARYEIVETVKMAG